MSVNASNTEKEELNLPPLEEDDFIPIDLDWRKKYYRRVFNKRVKAFLLDYLINNSIIIVLLIIMFLLASQIKGDNATNIITSLIGIISTFAPPILVSILESSSWKGSFGKRIMKIEISDDYGNPISFWRSIWRNVLKGITVLMCMTIVGFFIQRYFFLKSGKLLHDQLSKTVIGERIA